MKQLNSIRNLQQAKGTLLMRYFLGIDGGGTKTEALACTEDGVILAREISGPSNPLFVEKTEAFGTIAGTMHSALKGYEGKSGIHIHAAVCVPGIKKFKTELEKILLIFCEKVFIDSDEMNAFLGAVAKPYGIVVVSGTGSFALGINKNGDSIELGGWGPILGDEGSGYYIGLSSLKAVINEFEYGGPKTALTPKIIKFLQIKSIKELKRKVYSNEFDRSSMGNLSKLVREAGEEGDAVSVGIIDMAAYELADLANRVVANLKMVDGTYDAVLTGGVRKFGEMILKPFTENINRSNKNIIVKEPKFEPVVGSLLIAMKESGIDIANEGILKNLRDSYNNIR